MFKCQQTIVKQHLYLREQELTSICNHLSFLFLGVIVNLADQHTSKCYNAPDRCHELVRYACREKTDDFGFELTFL